jgi:TonB family protein
MLLTRGPVRTMIVSGSLALVAAPVLFAQEPEKVGQGRRLAHVALSGGGLYETMIDQAASVTVKSMLGPLEKEIRRELTPSERDALISVLRDTFYEVLPIGAWEEALAPIYAKYLTVSDMTEILTFYGTDLGQKLLSLQSRVLLDGMAIGESLAKTHEQQFRDRLQQKLQEVLRAFPLGGNSASGNQSFGPEIQFDAKGVDGPTNLPPPPPGVFRPGNGVDLPKVITEVKPQYTADAMRAKIQGVVILECVVNTDGTVRDVQVTRSLDTTYGLDEEAVKAAKGWRFEPGRRNGAPVPVLISIELTFTLRK